MLEITIKDTDTDSTENIVCDLIIAEFVTHRGDTFCGRAGVIGKGNKHIAKKALRELKNVIRRNM